MSEQQESTTQETTTTTTATTTPSAAPVAPTLTGKRANWTIAHKVVMPQNPGVGEKPLIQFAVKGAGNLELALVKCSAQVLERAALHGLIQRISDAAAMSRDPKTGASATPQEKFEAMRRLVEHYASGAEGWSPARSSEGVGRPRVDPNKELLVRALVIHAPEKGTEVVAKFVAERNAAQVTALLFSEQLKEAVELAREQLAEEARKGAEAEGMSAEELLKGL